MNSLIVICLLVVLPVCSANIDCYTCTTGCNDPFSASSTTVSASTTQPYAVCYKTTASGFATVRGGFTSASFCTASSYLGFGTYCCTTELCNGARSNFQASILMGLGLAVLFAKYRFL